MTRERYNELKRVSKERYESEHEQALFIDGAEWADRHPREGLWDAQKVIEWLNAVDFSKYVEGLRVVYVGRLKDDLIKAMED